MVRLTKLLMTILPTVEPWVVPGENVENSPGVDNVNPLDTLSSDLHAWGGRVRTSSRSRSVETRGGRAGSGGAACKQTAVDSCACAALVGRCSWSILCLIWRASALWWSKRGGMRQHCCPAELELPSEQKAPARCKQQGFYPVV